MTKSDIYCEHANENPNHCKCPSDCICWTATCKDKVRPNDCSSFSLAGAASDPCAKSQRRLRDLAKLAHEYGDENLRERLDPSKFGVSCDGPLGLVSEEEATDAIIRDLVPTDQEGFATERDSGVEWIDVKIVKEKSTYLLDEEWDGVKAFIGKLKKHLEDQKLDFTMRFVDVTSVDSDSDSKHYRTAMKLSLKLTEDLVLDTYYEVAIAT